VEVKDWSRMQNVLNKVELLLSTQMLAMMGSQAAPQTPTSIFEEIQHDGATIRFVQLPMFPTLSPCYAVDGDYLLLSPSINAIKAAINRSRGEAESVRSQADLTQILSKSGYTNGASSIFSINIERMVQLIYGILHVDPAIQTVFSRLSVVKSLAGVQGVKNGGSYSSGMLKMQ